MRLTRAKEGTAFPIRLRELSSHSIRFSDKEAGKMVAIIETGKQVQWHFVYLAWNMLSLEDRQHGPFRGDPQAMEEWVHINI